MSPEKLLKEEPSLGNEEGPLQPGAGAEPSFQAEQEEQEPTPLTTESVADGAPTEVAAWDLQGTGEGDTLSGGRLRRRGSFCRTQLLATVRVGRMGVPAGFHLTSWPLKPES